jgi:hypothetical protein
VREMCLRVRVLKLMGGPLEGQACGEIKWWGEVMGRILESLGCVGARITMWGAVASKITSGGKEERRMWVE